MNQADIAAARTFATQALQQNRELTYQEARLMLSAVVNLCDTIAELQAQPAESKPPAPIAIASEPAPKSRKASREET